MERLHWNPQKSNTATDKVWEQCKFRGYWNITSDTGAVKEFESSVNSEGIETQRTWISNVLSFESSVNSEGIETQPHLALVTYQFESSVNSEGIET